MLTKKSWHYAQTSNSLGFLYRKEVEMNTLPVTPQQVVSDDKMAIQPKPLYSFIEDLIVQRQAWQDGPYLTSNNILYSIKAKILAVYEDMTGPDAEKAKKLKRELDDYIKLHNLTFTKTTHTLTKLVRIVFGDTDKRRISTYSIVLRSAFNNGIKSDKLVEHIISKGGLQEIKLDGKGKSLTTKDKALVVEKTLDREILGVIHNEALAKKLDSGNIGQKVVFVATMKPSGAFEINLATNSTTAVNFALAACYNKKELAETAKQTEVASNDACLKQAIDKAAS